MADYQVRHSSANAPKEIKASAHYAYIDGGITLDGSTFSAEELVEAGTCVARNVNTGKYEAYTETTPDTFEPDYDRPLILDESVKFKLDDDGNNADQVVGEVLVHGAVYEGMLTGVTDAFKAKTKMIDYR